MLRRLIVKTRNKPKDVRDRYAFSIAVGFTSIVALVWLYHAPGRFFAGIADVPDDVVSPVASFFDQFGNQVASVKDSLPESSTSDSSSNIEGNWSTPEEYIERSIRRGKEQAGVLASSTDLAATSTASTSDEFATTTTSNEPREVRIVTTNQASTSASSSPQNP